MDCQLNFPHVMSQVILANFWSRSSEVSQGKSCVSRVMDGSNSILYCWSLSKILKISNANSLTFVIGSCEALTSSTTTLTLFDC